MHNPRKQSMNREPSPVPNPMLVVAIIYAIVAAGWFVTAVITILDLLPD